MKEMLDNNIISSPPVDIVEERQKKQDESTGTIELENVEKDESSISLCEDADDDGNEYAKKDFETQGHFTGNVTNQGEISQTDKHGQITQSEICQFYAGEENTQMSRTVTSHRRVIQSSVMTTCAGFAGQTSQVIHGEQDMPTVVLSDLHAFDERSNLTQEKVSECRYLHSVDGAFSATKLESTEEMGPEHKDIIASAKQTVSHVIQKSQQIASTRLTSSSTQTRKSEISMKKETDTMEHATLFEAFSTDVHPKGDSIPYFKSIQNIEEFDMKHASATTTSQHFVPFIISASESIIGNPEEQYPSLHVPPDEIPNQTLRIQEVTDDDDDEDEEIKKLTAGCELATYSLPSDLLSEEIEEYDSEDDDETVQHGEQQTTDSMYHSSKIMKSIKIGVARNSQTNEALTSKNGKIFKEEKLLHHRSSNDQEVMHEVHSITRNIQQTEQMKTFPADYHPDQIVDNNPEIARDIDKEIMEQENDTYVQDFEQMEVVSAGYILSDQAVCYPEEEPHPCNIDFAYQQGTIESPSKIDDITSQEITTESNLSISELDDDACAVDQELNIISPNDDDSFTTEKQSNTQMNTYDNSMQDDKDIIPKDKWTENEQQSSESHGSVVGKDIIPKPLDIEKIISSGAEAIKDHFVFGTSSCYTDDVKREDTLVVTGEPGSNTAATTVEVSQLHNVDKIFLPSVHSHIVQSQERLQMKEQLETDTDKQQTDVKAFADKTSFLGKNVDVIECHMKSVEVYPESTDDESDLKVKSSHQLGSQNVENILTEVNAVQVEEEAYSRITEEEVNTDIQNEERTSESKFIEVEMASTYMAAKKDSIDDPDSFIFKSTEAIISDSIPNIYSEASYTSREEKLDAEFKSTEKDKSLKDDYEGIDISQYSPCKEEENVECLEDVKSFSIESCKVIANVEFKELESTQLTKSIEPTEAQIIKEVVATVTSVENSQSGSSTESKECIKPCSNFSITDMGNVKDDIKSIRTETEISENVEPTEVESKEFVTVVENKNDIVTSTESLGISLSVKATSTESQGTYAGLQGKKMGTEESFYEDAESVGTSSQIASAVEDSQKVNQYTKSIGPPVNTDRKVFEGDEVMEKYIVAYSDSVALEETESAANICSEKENEESITQIMNSQQQIAPNIKALITHSENAVTNETLEEKTETFEIVSTENLVETNKSTITNVLPSRLEETLVAPKHGSICRPTPQRTETEHIDNIKYTASIESTEMKMLEEKKDDTVQKQRTSDHSLKPVEMEIKVLESEEFFQFSDKQLSTGIVNIEDLKQDSGDTETQPIIEHSEVIYEPFKHSGNGKDGDQATISMEVREVQSEEFFQSNDDQLSVGIVNIEDLKQDGYDVNIQPIIEHSEIIDEQFDHSNNKRYDDQTTIVQHEEFFQSSDEQLSAGIVKFEDVKQDSYDTKTRPTVEHSEIIDAALDHSNNEKYADQTTTSTKVAVLQSGEIFQSNDEQLNAGIMKIKDEQQDIYDTKTQSTIEYLEIIDDAFDHSDNERYDDQSTIDIVEVKETHLDSGTESDFELSDRTQDTVTVKEYKTDKILKKQCTFQEENNEIDLETQAIVDQTVDSETSEEVLETKASKSQETFDIILSLNLDLQKAEERVQSVRENVSSYATSAVILFEIEDLLNIVSNMEEDLNKLDKSIMWDEQLTIVKELENRICFIKDELLTIADSARNQLQVAEEIRQRAQVCLNVIKNTYIWILEIYTVITTCTRQFITAEKLRQQLEELNSLELQVSEKMSQAVEMATFYPELEKYQDTSPLATEMREQLKLITNMVEKTKKEMCSQMQKLEESLSKAENNAIPLPDLQNSIIAQENLIDSLQQTVCVHQTSNIAETSNNISVKPKELEFYSHQLKCQIERSVTHQRRQRISYQENLLQIPTVCPLYDSQDTSNALEAELEEFKSIITTVQEPSPSIIETQVKIIIELITEYFDIINFRIANALTMTRKQQIGELKAISDKLSAVEQHIESLPVQCSQIASTFSTEMYENISKCISLLQEQFSHATHSLECEMEIATSIKEEEENFTEQAKQLIKKVEVEKQTVEEVDNAVDDSSIDKATEIMGIDDAINIRWEELNSLQTKSRELALQCESCDLPDLNQAFCMLECLQEKASNTACAVQRASTTHEAFLVRMTHLASLVKCGEIWVQLDITVPEIDDLKVFLSKYKMFFNDVHANLILVNSLYSDLSSTLQFQYADNYYEMKSLTTELLQRAILRGQELEHCIIKWKELSHLLNINAQWIDITKDSLDSKKTVDKATLDEDISFFRNIHLDIDNHIPQIAAIKVLSSSIRMNVRCSSHENEVDNLIQKWNLIRSKTEKELSHLLILKEQWNAFEADIEEFQTWISHAERQATGLLEQAKETESIDAVETLKNIAALQTEQENRELLMCRISQFLQSSTKFQVYNSQYEESKMRQLENTWQRLTDILQSAHNITCENLSKSSPSDLTSKLQMWLENTKSILQEAKMEDLGSFSDAQLYLSKYQKIKLELQAKQILIKTLNTVDIKEHKSPEATQQASNFYASLGILNSNWQEVAGEVSARLKVLNALIGKWSEFKDISDAFCIAIQKHSSKVVQIVNVESKKKETVIEETLEELKTIEDWTSQTENLEQLSILSNTMQEVLPCDLIHSQSQTIIRQIQRQLTELKQSLSEANFLLDERRKRWSSYHHAWGSLNSFLGKLEYSISTYQLPLLHPRLCESYLEELKSLGNTMTENRHLLQELENETNDLRGDCEVSVQLELDVNLEVVQERWNLLLNSLAVSQQHLFDIHSQWQSFVSKSRELQEWTKNIYFQASILYQNDSSSSESVCQEALLALKEKEEEISQLEELEKYFAETNLFDQTANHIVHSIIVDHTESIRNINSVVQSKMNDIEKSSEATANCWRQICYVSEFLNTSEQVILCNANDASSKELQEILGNIKALMYQIPQYEVVLLSLREKLAHCNKLSPQICDNILQLLLHWKRFRTKLNDKYTTLEDSWLQKQQFVGKCRSILLFLHELQNQLALDIPSDYEGVLKEYCKLQVLELKLYAQQKVLHSLISEGLQLCQTMEKDTAEKFLDQLNQLYDQWTFISNLLVERQNVILHIISVWKQYYKPLHELQAWIDKTERQTIIVKKASVVTRREINKDILNIEAILDQKTYCNARYQDTVQASSALVPYLTGEGIELCKKERDKIKKQLDDICNLLQEKKKELLSLQEEWNKIESKIEEFKEMLKPTQSVIDEGILLSYDDLSNQYKEHQFQKERLKDLVSYIDTLEETVNKLDGKFASSEVSQIRNDATDFRQILVTLHHQLANRICIIEKKLNEWSKFHVDCSCLLQWILETERDILERGDECLEKACQKLEKEYCILIEQKSPVYNDIVTLGETLATIGGEKGLCVQEDLEELQTAWRKLNLCRIRRLEKLQGLLEEMRQLQQKMSKLNEWMENRECLLFVPVVYEHFAHSEIIRQTEIMEEYEEDIETHYRDLRSVISLCELLIHDNDAIVNPVEKDALQRSIESFKRRWKEVGTLPAERKLSIEETWNKWKKIMIDLDELESLIFDFENQTEAPKSNAIFHIQEESCEELKKFESLYQSFQPVSELLESVSKLYEELLNEGRLDSAGTLKNRMEEANRRWVNFTRYLDNIICRLSHTLQLWEEFQISREQLLLWLTELDLHLTEIQYFPDRSPALESHLKAFEEHEKELEMMNQLALHLQQRSEPSDCIRAEEMAKEVHDYWDRMLKRILYSQQMLMEEDEQDHNDDGSLKGGAAGNVIVEERSTILATAPPIVVTEHYEMPSDSSPLESTDVPSGITEVEDTTDLEESTVWEELESVLKETEERLSVTEEALRSQTPIGFETEHIPHNYSRLLAACRSSIDIIKHFSDLIEGESKGLTEAISPHYHHAQGIISRWEILELKTIEKERRLHQARHQWQQYMDDLITIENWLESAEDRQSTWTSPARDMLKLEFMIQNHREFLMEMIKQKPTVLSLNMLTQKFLSSSNREEAEKLQQRVKALNKRWEFICQAATLWQNELQKALLQCSEFRNTLQELITWLESSEEKIRQMGSTENISDYNVISIQYNKYLELKQELERCKPRITTFQQTADDLFAPSVISSSFGPESEAAEIHEQLNNANQRLQVLMNKCDTEIERLRYILQSEEDGVLFAGHHAEAAHGEVRIASETDLERSQINHCYRYLARVARASLPIQGLMLLLLGIASLVPMSEDDFSCVLTNNFARSFDPMLRYPDGPPPV